MLPRSVVSQARLPGTIANGTCFVFFVTALFLDTGGWFRHDNGFCFCFVFFPPPPRKASFLARVGAVFSVGAALLFPALAARAGHYAVTYAGGQMTATHNGVTSAPVNYILQSDNTWGGRIVAAFMGGYGGSGPQSGSAQCSGPITVTGTWMTDYPGEPPPAQVIVTQTCNAGWTGSVMNCTPSGNAANGLGSPLVVNADQSIGSSSGTTYQVMAGGNTVSFSCSPSASLSGVGTSNPTTGGTGTVYVSCVAQIAPPTVTLIGTTAVDVTPPDPPIGILIGQAMTTGFSAGGFPVSNYQWSVTGDAFEGFVTTSDWHTPPDPTIGTGQAVELTALVKQQSSLLYYYRSVGKSGDTSTVSCTATVTFPNGNTKQVTGSAMVKVYKPDHTFTATPGTVNVWNGGGVHAGDFFLGPSDPTTKVGILWNGKATTPPPFSDRQGAGIWGLAQIITPMFSYRDQTGAIHRFPQNGMTGSDGKFPYQNFMAPANGVPSYPSDSPGTWLGTIQAADFGGTFQTYMVYLPPDATGNSGTSWVPLHEIDWNFHAAANLIGNAWALLPVSNGVTITKDTPTTTLPAWTQVIVPGSF